MKFELFEAILHTATTAEDLRAENADVTDEEFQVYANIFAAMDGQRAIVSPSFYKDGEYCYIGLLDPVQSKELSYLMEQDPYMGCFIDQREEFDQIYDAGEYCPDGSWCLRKEDVEILGLVASADPKLQQEDGEGAK